MLRHSQKTNSLLKEAPSPEEAEHLESVYLVFGVQKLIVIFLLLTQKPFIALLFPNEEYTVIDKGIVQASDE